MMTTTNMLLLVFCSFVAAYGLTFLLYKFAPRLQLLQHANARSSHQLPTATGGGVSFAVVGLVVGFALSYYEPTLFPYMLFAALLAVVGFLDDLFELPSMWRFGLQLVSTVLLLWQVDLANQLPDAFADFGFMIVAPVFIVCAVWWLNLVNFMDGIDGLVATQAVAIFACASVLTSTMASNSFGGFEVWGWVVVAAVLGFLLLNFPPAKIFMGDAGSYFIAAGLFGLFVHALMSAPNTIVAWLLLALPLVGDATLTLLVRIFRREKWYAPHRQHAYQRLSRHWSSHRRVTLTYLMVTIIVLLPLSALSIWMPAIAWFILLTAYAAGMMLFIAVGAGWPDEELI